MCNKMDESQKKMSSEKYLTIVIYSIFQFIWHSRIVELDCSDRNQKSDCFYVCSKGNLSGKEHGNFLGWWKFPKLIGVVVYEKSLEGYLW